MVVHVMVCGVCVSYVRVPCCACAVGACCQEALAARAACTRVLMLPSDRDETE